MYIGLPKHICFLLEAKIKHHAWSTLNLYIHVYNAQTSVQHHLWNAIKRTVTCMWNCSMDGNHGEMKPVAENRVTKIKYYAMYHEFSKIIGIHFLFIKMI